MNQLYPIIRRVRRPLIAEVAAPPPPVTVPIVEPEKHPRQTESEPPTRKRRDATSTANGARGTAEAD